MSIKVLGIGSPFGDDQVGWHVAQGLMPHFSQQAAICIEIHDRPGMRLLELIRGFDTIFIIDAIQSGQPIGTLHQFQKESLFESETRFSTHAPSILQALQVASALDELPKAMIQFYGIEIGRVGLESTLSQPVERAVRALVLRLLRAIRLEL